MSAQLLLEELSGVSDLLAPTFLRMAHYMHICENQRAEQLFCVAFASDFSKDIARLFVEWENIPSEKLLGTITAYRSVLLEKHLSRQKKNDEIVSDIIYFPVVVNSMAVLLNFIYVCLLFRAKGSANEYFLREERRIAMKQLIVMVATVMLGIAIGVMVMSFTTQAESVSDTSRLNRR